MAMNIDLHGPWSAIRRSPMLRVVGPFLIGLLVAWYQRPSPHQVVVILLALTPPLLLVLLLPTIRLARWQRGLMLAVWIFGFGVFWQVLRLPENNGAHISRTEVKQGVWALRIEAINGVTDKLVRADASLLAAIEPAGDARPVHGSVMLAMMRGADTDAPRVGDRLLARASIAPIDRVADPGGFDRRGWAASRGIAWEAFVANGDRVWVDHPWRWTDLFADARAQVNDWLIASGLPKRERALVKALILGERDELDGEQKNAFARSGTIHVLAVSGMHVGLIFLALTALSAWLGQRKGARWTRAVLVLIALWGYAGLTGASPSVLRATVMFSLFTVAGTVRLRTEHLNSLCAAAFVLLLWDPAMLHHLGFQLSFLAVLGIILFLRPLQAMWIPGTWVMRQVWSLAAISLAAQAFTTPLSLYAFKAFPVWFLPANIVVVMAASLAVYGGVGLLVLHKLPVIGAGLSWCLTQLLRFVGWSTDLFAALPGAYPAVRASMLDMMLLYALVIALGAWWQWKWRGMRWVTGGVIALLLGSWAANAARSHERATFVVYDERDGFLAGMALGRTNQVLASSDSLLQSERTKLKLERQQRAMGIDVVISRSNMAEGEGMVRLGSTVVGDGRWRSAAFDVLFLNDLRERSLSGSQLDAIVLHDIRYIEENDLDDMNGTTQQVIIAGGLPWRARDQVKEWCEAHRVACHDVRQQGAFILER